MIVKNESKNIARLLKSVVPFIDHYVICDTGSTDGTISAIENFVKEVPNITGHIIYEPFQNFGHTRTYSFQRAKEYFPEVDFFMFLDADMVFHSPLSPLDFKKSIEDLSGDIYMLFQGNEHFSTKNARLCRGGHIASQCRYIGVTHEYLNYPYNSRLVTVQPTVGFIYDIGDGGSKSDKFQRDIRLLEEDLFRNPDNGRTLFYLGNSYKDSGQDEKAIEIYRRKIQLGETTGREWFEEIWHSYYNIGCCYRHLKRTQDAIQAWLQAFTHHPKRIENIYEIVKEYRLQGKPALAYEFYLWAHRIASSQKNKTDATDFLFTQRDVYEWKLDYELTIIGFYYNPLGLNVPQICMQLLSKPILRNHSDYRLLLNNYKHYVTILPQSEKDILTLNILRRFPFPKTLEPRSTDVGVFVSSTPSIVLHQNQLWVNIRYVNYSIDDQGKYVNKDYIITRNVLYNLYNDTSIEWEYEKSHDNIYKGIEDVRLLSKNGVLYYNGNRGVVQGHFKVEHGIIDIYQQKSHCVLLDSPHGQTIEKNWVMFPFQNKIKMVYKWYPLIIGEWNDENFVLTHAQTEGLPGLFQDVRGSTNGVVVGDEIWFVCHLVSHEDRRYYYHLFVVLDSQTFALKRYSHLYKILHVRNQVEYVLGLIACKNVQDELEFILGCSVLDRTTEFISVDPSKIQFM